MCAPKRVSARPAQHLIKLSSSGVCRTTCTDENNGANVRQCSPLPDSKLLATTDPFRG